jgi:hypothetical protein
MRRDEGGKEKGKRKKASGFRVAVGGGIKL